MADIEFDRLDLRLLALLQESCVLTNQDLSDRLHLSPSQISRRIARLRELGVIQREVAILNPAALGLAIQCYVFVTLSEQRGTATAFHQLCKSTPEIVEYSTINGSANFILKTYTRDMESFRQLLETICNTELVQTVKTNFVIAEGKTSAGLPLPSR